MKKLQISISRKKRKFRKRNNSDKIYFRFQKTLNCRIEKLQQTKRTKTDFCFSPLSLKTNSKIKNWFLKPISVKSKILIVFQK